MKWICKAVCVLFFCEFLLYGCCMGKLQTDSDDDIAGNVLNRLKAIEEKCELQANENVDLQREMANLEARISSLQTENQEMKKQIRILQTRDETLIEERSEADETTDFVTGSSASDTDEQKSRRNFRRFQESENAANVAFFAKISNHHLEHLGANQSLVFDHVITNTGNAYNSHAGDFRAPVTGTYVFSVTLMSLSTGTVHCQMVQSGKGVANIYVYTNTRDATSSVTAVLELKQGEDVAIHNLLADVNIHGYGYSYFSGFLLRQQFSNPDIIGK